VSEETMTVYKDGSLFHFPGPNPGTPYTSCGLDAGMFSRREHPINAAGIWCSECMRAMIEPKANVPFS